MWLKRNTWLRSRDQHQWIYISQSSREGGKCYLSGTEGGGKKKQALGLSPLGRSQQIQVASCWLCCFPTSVGLFVHPSPTAAHSCVLHAIAAPVCFFYLFRKKKKKKCDYLALTFAFVNIQRLLLVILVPGTSVLQIRWKPFWQLFLYLFAYLGTKTLQKVKLCLCLHVQSSQLHTSLQN